MGKKKTGKLTKAEKADFERSKKIIDDGLPMALEVLEALEALGKNASGDEEMGKKKTGKTVKAAAAGKKAMLKVYIQADILRRVRMTAANEGQQPGDLVGGILDQALPKWKR